ncbi:hypothetical protein [Longimicrobium terrae]|uniref:Uncharacterized protein n=1 Tax=Longimicrobium terrae TaxID=1639882 RepID=A0A841H345_9BACT|nr:hypothetical protein [Longimicrobium terrae]MBB4638041.1 hypothetical protein [Longimicrobium terrae]MBB6072413.1 hypothetical protein [Longimicrobium terrae]NNC32173.1 hypothetical protein [Longimicrobium terrae]
MQGRLGRVLVACAALAAAACGDAENVKVQPLPPLQRPTAEARAGLPEVRGLWRFAGFEIPARDTMLVREKVYMLTPLGDFQIATQRMDSIAGRYVRGPVTFPFTGEVRRDSVLAIVAFSGGVGQFLSGRVLRDTLWVEMTSFSSAVETWPRGTRAALVRKVGGAPFRRLLGGAPINVPVDSAALDSVRMDSLRRAGVLPPDSAQPVPGAMPPAAGMPPTGAAPAVVPQPGVPQQRLPQTQPAVPPANRPAQPVTRPAQPVTRPAQPVTRPAQPRPAQPRPPAQQAPPVSQPPVQQQPPVSQPFPQPAAPRDTIRFPG